jgi:hypothetical protein
MPGPGPRTLKKPQKEQRRKERQQEKIAKRRRQAGSGPETSSYKTYFSLGSLAQLSIEENISHPTRGR